MIQLRVTKYDPAKRDERGRYLLDEWTAFSDIGKTFAGVVLTPDEYQLAEDRYLLALGQLLTSAGIEALTVCDLECDETRISLRPNEVVLSVADGKLLRGLEIDTVARMVLREMLWCRLQGDENTYVHFGHDYYMYFGTEREIDRLPPPPSGMHYERFPSPY